MVRLVLHQKAGCERFRTFSACAWPVGLLHPTAREVFAGTNLEDVMAKVPNWFLRVIFLGSINLRRGHVRRGPPVFFSHVRNGH